MTDTIRVLLVTQTPTSPKLLDQVRSVSPRLAVEMREPASLPADSPDWRGVEVLYTDGTLPTPEAAPELRWVQGEFAGVDKVRDKPILQKVMLTNASGIHSTPIGEYTLMMMLAFSHRLPLMMHYQAKGEWSKPRWPAFKAQELRGATIGIVGYGSIGREVGRLARAFGMRVLALKREAGRTGDEGWRAAGVGDPALEQADRVYGPDGLRELLGESDYVVLAAPLTAETRGMIGEAELKAMKRTAVLINVARGGLVDEAAMIAALEAETIAGAALDVFTKEPLAEDSPLWKLPNVLLSPHISDVNALYEVRAIQVFADNLQRYLAGEPLLNVVDIGRGY